MNGVDYLGLKRLSGEEVCNCIDVTVVVLRRGGSWWTERWSLTDVTDKGTLPYHKKGFGVSIRAAWKEDRGSGGEPCECVKQYFREHHGASRAITVHQTYERWDGSEDRSRPRPILDGGDRGFHIYPSGPVRIDPPNQTLYAPDWAKATTVILEAFDAVCFKERYSLRNNHD